MANPLSVVRTTASRVLLRYAWTNNSEVAKVAARVRIKAKDLPVSLWGFRNELKVRIALALIKANRVPPHDLIEIKDLLFGQPTTRECTFHADSNDFILSGIEGAGYLFERTVSVHTEKIVGFQLGTKIIEFESPLEIAHYPIS